MDVPPEEWIKGKKTPEVRYLGRRPRATSPSLISGHNSHNKISSYHLDEKKSNESRRITWFVHREAGISTLQAGG